MSAGSFLKFWLLYGFLLEFGSTLALTSLIAGLGVVDPQERIPLIRALVAWCFLLWFFLGGPYLSFQAARFRADGEPDLSSALKSAMADARMKLSFLPVLGPYLAPSLPAHGEQDHEPPRPNMTEPPRGA